MIPVPAGLSYLPYQEEGIRFLLDKLATNGGAICADEMGLGKTVQAIGVINADPSLERVLIICPAGLKLNWKTELFKWSTAPTWVGIGNDRVQRNRVPFTEAPARLITVVNYEQLRKVSFGPFDIVIIDEGQYCKNPKSARTKAVFRLRKRCKKSLILTGTPILNRPEELFPLLQLTAPLQWDPAGLKGQELCGPGEGAGFRQYAARYCDAKKRFFGRKSFWDTSGASNLEELHRKLSDSVMIRRFKKDVLPELPPKRRQLIALPQTGVKTLLTEEMKIFGELTEDLTEASDRVAFSEISKVRRELAIKKVGPVVEHVKNALETTEKVIVFAHHTAMVDGLEKGLAEFNPGIVIGSSAHFDRHSAVKTFQLDSDARVIIGSIGAMGTGHTLTASSLVVFAEQSWSPSEMRQAEDRAHRIGQRDAVLVQHLVFENSLDSHMCEVLLKKQDIIDRAIDGKAIS